MNLKRATALLILLWGIAGLNWTRVEAQTKKTVVRLNYSGSIYATTSVVGVEKSFFDLTFDPSYSQVI